MRQDSDWTVELSTMSRDGAIKMATLLARGIDPKRIEQGLTKIIIIGAGDGGKTLVIDAMTRDFADGYSPYKMPKNGMIEKMPLDAIGHYLDNKFYINDKKFIAAFYREGISLVSGIEMAVEKTVSKVFNLFSGRIEFETTGYLPDRVARKMKYDCVIDLRDKTTPENPWMRGWEIEIISPDLKTPRMQAALELLRTYEDRRQKRVAKLSIAA